MSAPIGSLRSPLPPHRRGKLILRDSARKRSVTKPPLRERGRGTAKRWWGRKETAACGIETVVSRRIRSSARGCTTHKAACGIETWNSTGCVCPMSGCTTHKAACGIETRNIPFRSDHFAAAPLTKPRAALKLIGLDLRISWADAAPLTKPRAALKRSTFTFIFSILKLHHPQSRVRH